jgi:hypothetical protein
MFTYYNRSETRASAEKILFLVLAARVELILGAVTGVGALWRLFLVVGLLGLRGRLGLGRRVGRRGG